LLLIKYSFNTKEYNGFTKDRKDFEKNILIPVMNRGLLRHHFGNKKQLKTEVMKKLSLVAVLMITFTLSYGQKSIDALFEKYAGKDGFTTVTINGSLLKLARCFDSGDDHTDKIPDGLTEIRILSQEDKSLNAGNFYNMIIKDIDLTSYEEFMRVKETNQDLRMLVRMEGRRFREFLMIAGGEDNAVIQIKGDLTFDDAKKLSEDVIKNNGMDIMSEKK
jgi:hypothetical protein